MTHPSHLPRILFITPQAIFAPKSDFFLDDFLCTQEGTEADFFSYLLSDLYHLGADIHVVQPDYRKIFSSLSWYDANSACDSFPGSNVHLAKDRIFYYTPDIDTSCDWENIRISMALQREVIQYFIPVIQPDLIHCFGWMTGLIPAAAKSFDIPCLFSIRDLRTHKIPLWNIEDMGIDAAVFWTNLFYDRMPAYYEETRESNLADLLLSGIHSATHIDAASPDVLTEIIKHLNSNKKTALEQLLKSKYKNRCISSICSNIISTQAYIDMYENLLQEPIIEPSNNKDIQISQKLSYTTIAADYAVNAYRAAGTK